MAEYVRMPKAHYEAACNSIRAKTGKGDLIKSGDMSAEIESITGGGSADVRYVTFKSYDGAIEYGKIPVAAGYDCPNPKFDTPTRESTVQYNYTFYGWATTPNGGADANWNKSITEDKTVYANFSAAVRYYTITYYDGDTVLKTESLAYGSMPAYVGEKDGYNFEGWEPALTTVTGDASYHAQWSSAITFAGASWADIAEISASGKAAETFAVGDTREVAFTDSNGNTEVLTVAIAGFNHDDLADGSGKAGISIVCMNLPNLTTVWNESTEPGWYPNSTIKKTLDGWKAYLPDALQSVIKPVIKKCDNSATSGSTSKTDCNCELWPLSWAELGWTYTGCTYYPPLGNAYAIFPKQSVAQNYPPSMDSIKAVGSTYYNNFWTRQCMRGGVYSPTCCGNKYDPYTTKTAICITVEKAKVPTTSYRVRFGFCI
jgi:hypothetical protein